MGDSIHCVSY